MRWPVVRRRLAPSAQFAARWWVTLFVSLLGGGAAALPLVLDAEGVARGGASVLASVEASPGSPRPLGWRVRVDAFQPYPGTGLVAGAVAFEHVGGRAGAGAAFATLWTPVGEVQSFETGLQLRHRDLRAGVGIEVRGYGFTGYPAIWEVGPRAGAGWTLGSGFVVAAVVERGPGPPSRPQLRAAVEARVVDGIRLAMELQREPGLRTRTSFGIVAGDSPLRLDAGFDIATQSCSVGFAWLGERQRVAWGARTHPVLGWSHAWTYERSY